MRVTKLFLTDLQKPLRYEAEQDIKLVPKMSKFILHKKKTLYLLR